MQPYLAGCLSLGKLVEAQARGIVLVALVDLHQRKVGALHHVRTAFHVRGVVCRVRRHGTSRSRANAELARRRLVIGIGKTPSEARAIHEVTNELNPGVVGRADCRDYPRPVRKFRKQFLGVAFHAIERFRILIEKREEHDRDSQKPGKLPLLGPQAGQYAKTKDGRNGGEAKNQKSNPAPVKRWAKIFRKKSGCTHCEEIELQWEN